MMPGITVILNAWRRSHLLGSQIKSIVDQTVPVSEIWCWVNDHSSNQDLEKLTELPAPVTFIRAHHNFKYHGRFAAALLSRTPYVALFDDDTMPGKKWLENCLATYEKYPGILGSAGVILNNARNYVDHDRIGWPSQNTETTKVDLVGHAWFIPRLALQTMWIEPPLSLDNAEDIQLSYMAQKYASLSTYCPPHPPNDKDLWGSLRAEELGIDEVGSSTGGGEKHFKFMYERSYCVANSIARGWNTIKNLKI